jgi:hypothetical protein
MGWNLFFPRTNDYEKDKQNQNDRKSLIVKQSASKVTHTANHSLSLGLLYCMGLLCNMGGRVSWNCTKRANAYLYED